MPTQLGWLVTSGYRPENPPDEIGSHHSNQVQHGRISGGMLPISMQAASPALVSSAVISRSPGRWRFAWALRRRYNAQRESSADHTVE